MRVLCIVLVALATLQATRAAASRCAPPVPPKHATTPPSSMRTSPDSQRPPRRPTHVWDAAAATRTDVVELTTLPHCLAANCGRRDFVRRQRSTQRPRRPLHMLPAQTIKTASHILQQTLHCLLISSTHRGHAARLTPRGVTRAPRRSRLHACINRMTHHSPQPPTPCRRLRGAHSGLDARHACMYQTHAWTAAAVPSHMHSYTEGGGGGPEETLAQHCQSTAAQKTYIFSVHGYIARQVSLTPSPASQPSILKPHACSPRCTCHRWPPVTSGQLTPNSFNPIGLYAIPVEMPSPQARHLLIMIQQAWPRSLVMHVGHACTLPVPDGRPSATARAACRSL